MLSLAVAAANQRPKQRRRFLSLRPSVAAHLFLVVVGLLFSGCSHNRHTFDPRLRTIDALLNSNLPAGTTRGRVEYFLKSRGYELEAVADKTTVRALVRHVDPGTLDPAAANATFHFDANGKLTGYELAPAPF